jgi:hypothetical protein
MPKTTAKTDPSKTKVPSKTEADSKTAHEEKTSELVDSLTGTVDQWRARIDELKVQVDLARLDTRDRATKQLEIAQNACLAAYSKLRDAGKDVVGNADTLRDGVQKLLQDVKAAFEAAQAVINRG